MLQNIKLLIAYDGTRYFGWQKTKMGPSIEEELEKALQKILQEKVQLQAASRTDRGVHAEGQVANFFTLNKQIDLNRLQKSLNSLLPKDISILKVEVAKNDFHPTLDSKGKEYHYQLCYGSIQFPFQRQFSWHFPYFLDIDKMQKAASYFIGEQDFSAFCNERRLMEKSALRSIHCIDILPQDESCLLISVVGNHFLYKMVRNIVGTLAYVGCGKLSLEALPRILTSKDRAQAGVTAPAHGLRLKQVFYIPK